MLVTLKQRAVTHGAAIAQHWVVLGARLLALLSVSGGQIHLVQCTLRLSQPKSSMVSASLHILQLQQTQHVEQWFGDQYAAPKLQMKCITTPLTAFWQYFVLTWQWLSSALQLSLVAMLNWLCHYPLNVKPQNHSHTWYPKQPEINRCFQAFL